VIQKQQRLFKKKKLPPLQVSYEEQGMAALPPKMLLFDINFHQNYMLRQYFLQQQIEFLT
jgi:hypothetical protein